MRKDRGTTAALEWISQTYKQLEEETGFYEAQWSRWFLGMQSPTYATMRVWAIAAGVTVPDIVYAFEYRSETMRQLRTDRASVGS